MEITNMPAVFDKLGVHFDYPDNWLLEEDAEGLDSGVVNVVVTSPQSAFWHLSKHPADTDLETLFDEGLAAMRIQYSDMEVGIADDLTSAGGWMDELQATGEQQTMGVEGEINRLYGYNISFICLDLTITAWMRGIQTPTASYLLLCQAEDRELLEVGAIFRAMWISLLRNEHGLRNEPW